MLISGVHASFLLCLAALGVHAGGGGNFEKHKHTYHDHHGHDETPCPLNVGAVCKYPLHALTHRLDFGKVVNERGFEVGAELGVQSGWFSDSFLYDAHSIKKYYLVDTWEHRGNYSDWSNVAQTKQEALMQSTLKRLEPYGVVKVLRMWTTEAAKKILDNSVDWVYVDARHDFKGVLEDIEAWWTKLKIGGIMAGDDFVTAAEHLESKNGIYDPEDDWSKCYDGSIHPGAVKGAVHHFAERHDIKVYNTLKNRKAQQGSTAEAWPQWIFEPKLQKHIDAGIINEKHDISDS